jgi:putative N6-adenine-specific DNA methylase
LRAAAHLSVPQERLIRHMVIKYLFATVAKGIEEVLAGEMKEMGFEDIAVEKGGVRFRGNLSTCYRANLWLRTANRILIPLVEFGCDTPQRLYEGIRSVSWHEYLNPDMTLAVDCNLRDSDITHSGFAALKTKDAVVDSIRDFCGRRPSVDVWDPDVRINIHIFRNRCTVSLDSSGESLDKRGYRLDTGEAPLRETLAAALVELSGWDGTIPLVDPMCGSGTICIEALLKALRLPPGGIRKKYGFQRWPSFDHGIWNELIAEANSRLSERIHGPVIGFDISPKAIQKARTNATRAGVEKFVSFSAGDIVDMVPAPSPGILIFNPPYGARMGQVETLKELYRSIGDTMKKRCKGYTAYLFTGNPELGKWVGLKPSRRIVLFNGPIECRLLKYDLY